YAKDGRIRFARFQGDQPFAFIMDADGTNQHRDTSIPGLKTGVWSPDDKRVIFYKENDDSGTLYLANSDGSDEIKLPFLAGNMDWSPDSSKIIYQFGKANQDIYLYSLETGKIETVVSDPAFDADPSFSPDGKSIAFVSGRDGNLEIYSQNLDGSGLRRLTSHPAHDSFPVFSPDGTQISFNSNREDENFDIYIMNVDGSEIHKLTNSKSDEMAYPGCWSADGTKMFFIGNQSGKDNIYIMDIEPFAHEELLTDSENSLLFPEYSPDGKKLLYQAELADKTGEMRVMDLDTKRT